MVALYFNTKGVDVCDGTFRLYEPVYDILETKPTAANACHDRGTCVYVSRCTDYQYQGTGTGYMPRYSSTGTMMPTKY